MLVPRERVPALRERVLVPREPVGFAVAEREPVGFALAARDPVGLALARVVPVAAFARPDEDLRPVEPEVPDFARVPVDLRAPPRPEAAEDPDDDDEEPEVPLALPSAVHLPLITRCAASATASAMIDPSLVALDMTLVAAWDAVSAASRPASRILRRAAGLALIAAAAAARPAASISLLMAALASLSSVSLPDDELEEPPFDAPEEFLVEDFAIASTPSVGRKDTRMP